MPFDPLHPFHPPSKPCLCMCVQSCPTLCNPVDCSLPGSSVHGIFQAKLLGWVAISYSRGSSHPQGQTRISWVSCIGRQTLYHWATWEAHLSPTTNLCLWAASTSGLNLRCSFCKSSPATWTSLLFLQPCQHIPSSEPLPLAFSLPGTLSPRGSRDMLPPLFPADLSSDATQPVRPPRAVLLFCFILLCNPITTYVRKSICLGAYCVSPTRMLADEVEKLCFVHCSVLSSWNIIFLQK